MMTTTMKKVSIFVCFFAIFSFLFISTAVANNPDHSKGPKWKENPSPPNHSGEPKGPKGPEINPPENQELPSTPPTNKGPKGPSGPAGKSDTGHLYLYEKVEPPQPYPPGTPWEIVENGAWGKLKYPLEGPTFKFVFDGHNLEPEVEYTLIYFVDPWPGTGLICLGSAMSNGGGNVHIMGSPDTGDLPIEEDLNNPDNPGHDTCITDSTCIEGAKIWLVLSSDVDCGTPEDEESGTPGTPGAMTGWNPAQYLFEDVGIFYVETGQ